MSLGHEVVCVVQAGLGQGLRTLCHSGILGTGLVLCSWMGLWGLGRSRDFPVVTHWRRSWGTRARCAVRCLLGSCRLLGACDTVGVTRAEPRVAEGASILHPHQPGVKGV